MDSLLFSGRSIWTMTHGIGLGGGALIMAAMAIFALRSMQTTDSTHPAAQSQARHLGWLTVAAATALWLSVLVGTYIIFPPYRAAPQEGVADLARYPRSMLLSDPGTAWLHAFAMEIKEHVPWIAAMLATAVAFVAVLYRARLLADAGLNRMASAMIAICFMLAAAVGVLGILINKVAPLE
jgi:hypothetical protein